MMTETEQQIALCEWAGWKFIREGATVSIINPEGYKEGCWQVGDDKEKQDKWICGMMNSYHSCNTNSLDVLHEMVTSNKLSYKQRQAYTTALEYITKAGQEGYQPYWFAVATAKPAQIREALLRTLGLWKE